MSFRLESGFEAKLREAVLADVERQLRDDIGPLLVETARQNWIEYANANGYDIDFVWEEVDGPTIQRRRNAVMLRVEWPGLSALFEFGVSPHTIEGNPLLHFYWEAKDQWIKTESVNWGSETGGIDGSRAVRDALSDIEQELRAA